MRVTSLLRPTYRSLARSTPQAFAQQQPWRRSMSSEPPQSPVVPEKKTASSPSIDTITEVRQSLLAADGEEVPPKTRSQERKERRAAAAQKALEEEEEAANAAGSGLRYPRSVQALYLQPLRCEAEYGIPSCDLQLRSYSARNLEFFADFAVRAAYYLKLPAFGPSPLPRIVERWTVPRSSFIYKKSQENFERITLRRLIQIRDGNPETVQLWLAFLQKHAYYGIGMKANVWDFGKLSVGKTMDTITPEASEAIESKWEHLGQHRTLDTLEGVEEFLARAQFNTDSGKRAEGDRRFAESKFNQARKQQRKEARAAAAAAAEAELEGS